MHVRGNQQARLFVGMTDQLHDPTCQPRLRQRLVKKAGMKTYKQLVCLADPLGVQDEPIEGTNRAESSPSTSVISRGAEGPQLDGLLQVEV